LTQQASVTFPELASKLGGPTQDNSADTTGPLQQVASAPGDKQMERARKVDDKSSPKRYPLPSLPPPQETFKQGELLAANPSPKVLAEMERRSYSVERPKGGVVRVTLPPGAGDVWDVQRELAAKFPDQNFGLNFIYQPYRAQTDISTQAPSPVPAIPCTDESCPWRKLIDWREELATCAASLNIAMIDTQVDRTHPAFAGGRLKTLDFALKQDAAPAPHWHGTGVLSVMLGKPTGGTPGLIPGAQFTALNVFFTNKNSELETDTAHLTEALAWLDEKEDVQIVNLSLVGPRDELVHARIADMAARKGVVFVAAAGNGGPDAAPGYPAAYEEVIAVTAVDRKGGNYDHANRGAHIDVAAPGVQIRAALPDAKQGILSGTSFAAPFVTAVVAVAYQDSGLNRAVRAGQGSLDPKGMMLARLFSKDEQKRRNPIYGLGLIKAPLTCGSGGDQPWLSVVKPTPSVPVAAVRLARPPAAPIAQDTWHSVVRASQPSGEAR
jgi:hypothetical protein